MENLGSMAESGYTGHPEITDRDATDLQCSLSDEGSTYSFWGHFIKGQGHGHFHGHFSGHNSYNIILIQYKFAVAGPYLTWSVF